MTSDLYVNMLEGNAMRDVEVAMGGVSKAVDSAGPGIRALRE